MDTKNQKKEGFWTIWADFSPTIRFFIVLAAFVTVTFAWIATEESFGVAVHHSQHKPKIDGYWGNVTANLDWCEDNYVSSFWLAEFWNSISSLTFVFFALSLYMREIDVFKTSKPDKAFLWVYICTAAIGFGSFLFHGTLKWGMQTMDELPMVYGTSCLIYVLETIEDLPKKRVSGNSIGSIMVAITIFATFVEFSFPSHPELFQFIFVGEFLYTVYLSVNLYRKCKTEKEKKSIEQSLMFLTTGSLFWVVEPFVCSRYGWLQLHSWWHIFSSIGLYKVIYFSQEFRSRVLDSNKLNH